VRLSVLPTWRFPPPAGAAQSTIKDGGFGVQSSMRHGWRMVPARNPKGLGAVSAGQRAGGWHFSNN